MIYCAYNVRFLLPAWIGVKEKSVDDDACFIGFSPFIVALIIASDWSVGLGIEMGFYLFIYFLLDGWVLRNP